MLEYDFVVLHRKETQHHVPDALSQILKPAEVAAKCDDPEPEQAQNEKADRTIVVSTVVTRSKRNAAALPEREEKKTARTAASRGRQARQKGISPERTDKKIPKTEKARKAAKKEPAKRERTAGSMSQKEEAVEAAVKTEETADEWYRRRYKEFEEPEKFPSWKVVDGHLYFLRPRKIVSDIIKDLDEWKLVLPKERRRRYRNPMTCHRPVIWGWRKPSTEWRWHTIGLACSRTWWTTSDTAKNVRR